MAIAYSQLAMTYEALGDIPRLAKEHYERSVRASRREISMCKTAMPCFCAANATYKAARHFDKAIEHPENDNAFVTMTNAGMCLLRRSRTKRVPKSTFRAALERRPGHGDALLQLCLMKYSEERLSWRAGVPAALHVDEPVRPPACLYLAARALKTARQSSRP